jgi:hypothetical protein
MRTCLAMALMVSVVGCARPPEAEVSPDEKTPPLAEVRVLRLGDDDFRWFPEETRCMYLDGGTLYVEGMVADDQDLAYTLFAGATESTGVIVLLEWTGADRRDTSAVDAVVQRIRKTGDRRVVTTVFLRYSPPVAPEEPKPPDDSGDK